MKKTFISYELTDGTINRVRILAADRIAFERTARINNWPVEDGPRAMALILFAALKRTRAINEATEFETFVASDLVDLAAESEDANPTN